MVSRPTIVGVSGSLGQPSRTTVLVNAVTDGIGMRGVVDATLIQLAEDAKHLFASLSRDALTDRGRAIIEAVEAADLLVVGTPVYRASYTGALKHFFDLVDHRRFAGKPVVLVATGGTLMHGLVMEHALRPLFGFLGALTLPTTVYAIETDFVDYRIGSAKIRDRVEQAADEAIFHLRVRQFRDVDPAQGRVGRVPNITTHEGVGYVLE